MSDSEDSAARELCPDGVLYEVICLQIDGGRGFVQN